MTIPQQLDAVTQNDKLWKLASKLPFILESDMKEISEISAAECSHLWILSIVRSAEVNLMDKILQIPKISASGRTQLLADFGYFRNILAALEIELDENLEKVLEFLKMPSVEFEAMRSSSSANNYMKIIANMRSK